MSDLEKPLSTKARILRELTSPRSDDGFVSGQELAEKCKVSRTAVWKAVQTLMRQGMEIEAVTNKGYHLKGCGNSLNRENIEVLLSPGIAGRICVYKTIDSTNTEAKRWCAEKSPAAVHKSVIVAEQQTAGRGRMGRAFYSPAESGLYLSILYSPCGGVRQPAKMTAGAAVAVCRSLDRLYGITTRIKWVNDIFYNGRKVCGILTEGISSLESGIVETAIVGIGVNISNGTGGFPAEIAAVAGSVLGNGTSSVSRNQLAASIIEEALKIYDAETDGRKEAVDKVMQEYKERSMIIGKTVEVCPLAGSTADSYKAAVLDIGDDASLIVQDEKGCRRELQSGEITLHSDNFLS